ncbi:YggS family pyridoxal phosphate-dependent enzyme [Aestuariivirga sp.]|uniref:YggS family pyridoxal phosphate-dependent enzyme n=1 Tax=Aestuariivirga sp. TaxID=2650926 RepID=UPI0025B81868|nr:YggS family pyridoxal phosphate-dependent enzyme [Aestuariivirga sp.]MCA3554430.1 YggS family pyridoxal phosphate-dependent enzyme [Aestuariivirga sp.]
MVHEGLKKLLNGVAAATRQAHRAPESVTLIAVSKTFGGPEIVPVIEAGQRVFGENRVQEAKSKWPALRMAWPDIELHLIGPLQSNKAAEAVQIFDAIHTVDRPKIAAGIASEMRRQAKRVKLFVQVNTGREPQKAGIDPDQADAFLKECRDVHGLEISGLMCIPPDGEDPNPHFTLLAGIAARNGLSQLSMGMSGDYATAIACGATHVRVGSAIFGTRPQPA